MSKNRTERDILEDLKKRFPRIGFEGLLYYEICTEACTLVEQMRAGKLGTATNGMKLVISIESESTYVSPGRHRLWVRPVAWNPV